MNEKYLDKMNNNQKLSSFSIKVCEKCKNKLNSIITITNQGGDAKLCYSCNVKMGNIK